MRLVPVFLVCWFAASTGAHAHVLQHLTWFHVERTIAISPQEVRVTHICRFDEDRFHAEDGMVDTDGDSTASQRELTDFCLKAARYLEEDLIVLHNGSPGSPRREVFKMLPEDAGFRSEITAPIAPPLGELQIIDPAYLLPVSRTAKPLSTQLHGSPGVQIALPNGDDSPTTAPSTLRTILRLTATTSGTLTATPSLEE